MLANYRQASLQRQAQRYAHKQAPHLIASFRSAVPKFDQCRYLNETLGQKVSSTKAMDSYTNINIGHTGLKWGGKKKGTLDIEINLIVSVLNTEQSSRMSKPSLIKVTKQASLSTNRWNQKSICLSTSIVTGGGPVMRFCVPRISTPTS